MKKVAIIGSGISGLLSAFFLQKKGHAITVFEKQNKSGGKLQTTLSPYGLMESAANGILSDSLVEDVCREIGVELIPTLKSSRTRWIYKNGKPRRWPVSFMESFALAAFLIKKPWRDSKNLENKTLEQWLKQYFKKDTVDYLFSPACQGIFGRGAEELSAKLIMEYFFNKKTIPKGKLRGTVCAEGGMGEIVKKLESYLRQKNVVFKTEDIETLSPLIAEFQEVVVATDMHAAAQLLETIRDHRGAVLKNMPRVDLISINAFFPKEKNPFPGFGILFPRREAVAALGVLQNTFIFPDRSKDCFSETWIYASSSTSEEQMLEELRRDRERVFGSLTPPLEVKINFWPQALPLYGKELENTLSNFPPGHPRVHLIGNYMGQLGLNRLFMLAQNIF